ncbi:MAG: YidC/Oxa1 family membrane protein insertase [Candidatus Dormibacteria bacterium]
MGTELLTFHNPAWPPPTNTFEQIFFYLLLTPMAVVLQFLDHVFRGFSPTDLIGAFGVAVVVLTLIIRGCLFPLFRWQIRTQWKVQANQRRMGPELRELQAKYKKDRPRLQQETMALYKRHQINPLSQLSGCLPLLIQMPFIYALFGSINKLSHTLHGQTGFLWIPNLEDTALKAGLLSHPTLVIVPILAGIFTFAQSKMMVQPARPDMTDQERQMYKVMSQTTYIMPIVIAFFALNFNQGIGLYWITQSAVMVAQIFFMMGWGGLKVPPWFPGAGWHPRNSPLGDIPGAPAPAYSNGRGTATSNGRGAATGNGQRPAPKSAARRQRRRERGRRR